MNKVPQPAVVQKSQKNIHTQTRASDLQMVAHLVPIIPAGGGNPCHKHKEFAHGWKEW